MGEKDPIVSTLLCRWRLILVAPYWPTSFWLPKKIGNSTSVSKEICHWKTYTCSTDWTHHPLLTAKKISFCSQTWAVSFAYSLLVQLTNLCINGCHVFNDALHNSADIARFNGVQPVTCFHAFTDHLWGGSRRQTQVKLHWKNTLLCNCCTMPSTLRLMFENVTS